MSRPVLRTTLTAVVSVVTGLAAMLATLSVSVPAQAANVATPGNFTGYGFDQCLAPTQSAMNAWLRHSPFLAVGIYISGDSRGLPEPAQPDPELGRHPAAQGLAAAADHPRPAGLLQSPFPEVRQRRDDQPQAGASNGYSRARVQGRAEANKAVPRREGAGHLGSEHPVVRHRGLRPHPAPVPRVGARLPERLDLAAASAELRVRCLLQRRLGHQDPRRRPREPAGKFNLPDRIWLARWDGKANTSSSYIRDDGWRPGGRVKQYQGGHNETWGGVTINIDRNFLDVGRGFWARPETHCEGTRVSYGQYRQITPTTVNAEMVSALQCLLQERDLYGGRLHGRYTERLAAGIRAWREQRGFAVNGNWGRKQWTSLLSAGRGPVLKYGSAGGDVRRLQRALNAASTTAELTANGLFKASTKAAVRAYQRKVGIGANGIVGPSTWQALRAGRR